MKQINVEITEKQDERHFLQTTINNVVSISFDLSKFITEYDIKELIITYTVEGILKVSYFDFAKVVKLKCRVVEV